MNYHATLPLKRPLEVNLDVWERASQKEREYLINLVAQHAAQARQQAAEQRVQRWLA